MSIDTLKEKLADIDADILRDFIFDLSYPELNDKIEVLTLANDPVALSKAFHTDQFIMVKSVREIFWRANREATEKGHFYFGE